jgi:hypothetical protein
MELQEALSNLFKHKKEWIYWRDKKPTEKQVKFIRNCGEKVGRKMTRGMASDKITELMPSYLHHLYKIEDEYDFFDPWFYKD